MTTQEKLASIINTKLHQHRIQIRNYSINYVTAGSGPDLLLLHGVNMGWCQWFLNIAELAKHFKVYALDLPGAGSSTPVTFSKMDFTRDFVDVVDEFIQRLGITRVDLIGSSFGGWIALKLASAGRPYIRKLVLANPLGFTTHMPAKFRPISFRPLATLLTKTILRPHRGNKKLETFMRDVFYDKQQTIAPEFIDYFYELSTVSHMTLFISRLSHWSGMRAELYLHDELPKVKQPVLIVWGKADPLMPYKRAQENFRLIPTVEVKMLDNAGHMPPIETSQIFNDACINFLRA